MVEGYDENQDNIDVDREFWMEAVVPFGMVGVHRNRLDYRLSLGSELSELLETAERIPDSEDEHGNYVLKFSAEKKEEELLREIQKSDLILVKVRDGLRKQGYPLPLLPESISYLRDATPEGYEKLISTDTAGSAIILHQAATSKVPYSWEVD